MELWIRSSNKEMLLKANKIKYEHYKPFLSDYYTEVISINDELIEEYKTKERALEVLDEIQDILIDYAKISRVVYQMPEE